MHRLVFLIVGIALVCGIASAEAEKKDELAAVKAKAAALVKDQNDRMDKIIALQKFVRDQVIEVKTQYG